MWTIMYIYRGLMWGDGDAIDFLGMKPDGDGHGDPEPQEAYEHHIIKMCFMISGTVFVNIVLLNVTIAVYGNEYDKNEEAADSVHFRLRSAYISELLLLFSDLKGGAVDEH